MESDRTVSLYNLSLVLNETGLKADVLRAWERRYGLPKPVRSAGGQRLYSRQDIATVKWLQARQAEGISIKRATDLWKELVMVAGTRSETSNWWECHNRESVGRGKCKFMFCGRNGWMLAWLLTGTSQMKS